MNHRRSKFDSVEVGRSIRSYLSSQNISTTLPDLYYEILALQIRDSISRVRYFEVLSNRDINIRRTDPNDTMFDPIKAIMYYRDINYDEACWLTFLISYTSENPKSKWYFTRKLYAGLNKKLTWKYFNDNIDEIEKLSLHLDQYRPKLKFGNHRKYISLQAMASTFDSYLNLINSYGGHSELFRSEEFNDPEKHFKRLFGIIQNNIIGFGRLSTFDYLSNLNKTDLANIEADSCYIKGSTGPKDGARMLFGAGLSDRNLDILAMHLANHLGIGYQEMEDSLCNWQKSPNIYESFKG